MLYEELTTVVPFYLSHINQDRFKENVRKNCQPQKLISPKDVLLPFMIHVHCGKKPTKWLIKDANGNTAIDASLSLPKIEGTLFSDGKVYAYFKGGRLEAWRNPNWNKSGYLSLNLDDSLVKNPKIPVVLVGEYYHEITFGDITYSSEVIHYLDMTEYEMQNQFMKIEFRSNTNINTLRYPKDFKQILWLDTFSHSSRVEYEEEGEQDGENNFIPTFQRMQILYQNEVVTNDFLKNAIHALKLHDDIKIHYKDERYGDIYSIMIESENTSDGALHSVKFDFLCTLLVKSGCDHSIEQEDYFNAILIDDIEITIFANTNTYRTLDYGLDAIISSVEIIEHPATTQLMFVDNYEVEFNPQPYFEGVDNFKMKVTTEDGRVSNAFNVKINIVSNWIIEDMVFNIKKNDVLEIVIPEESQSIEDEITGIIITTEPELGELEIQEPETIFYTAPDVATTEQIFLRAKKTNDLISSEFSITIVVN